MLPVLKNLICDRQNSKMAPQDVLPFEYIMPLITLYARDFFPDVIKVTNQWILN